MIIEALAAGAMVKTLYDANKSLKMDERALEKYAKAFEKSGEAEIMVKKKAEYTDKRLANVAKKKRAILKNTVPKFVDVYGQIQKIELEGKVSAEELFALSSTGKVSALGSLALSTSKGMTDRELVCKWLFHGLGGVMVKDSEQFLSAANNQMRAANIVYSQSETISEIYDAVIARADRIANLLSAMNALFIKSISETEETIRKNGLNVHNYNEYEKGVLMTCVNMAAAISDIIDVPVVNENGQVCEAATAAIIAGEQYMEKMNQTLREG